MTITIANLSFSPIVLILSLVVIVNLALAWRTWRSNPRHPVNIFFALTVLMAATWVFLISSWPFNDSPTNVGLVLRLIHLAPVLLVLCFYLFTYYFPYKKLKLAKSQFFILLSFVALVVFITITPNLMIVREVASKKILFPYFNLFWYIVYACYFLSVVFLSFFNLWLKYKQADGIWRKRLKQVMIATVAAFLGGAFFNLMLPILLNHYILDGYLGPLFTLFTAAYIWYHIFRKQDR